MPFTNVAGSNVLIYSNKGKTNELDNSELIDDIIMVGQSSAIIEKNKFDLEKSFIVLRIFINAIKLLFKNYPIIIYQCHQILTNLAILLYWPDIICEPLMLILGALLYLYEIFYSMGITTLASMFEFWIEKLTEILIEQCVSYPYLSSSGMFPRTHGIAILSDLIQLSKLRTCPCIQEENK